PPGRGKRTLLRLFADEVRLSGSVAVTVEPGPRLERDLARVVAGALAGEVVGLDADADPVAALLELGRRGPVAVVVPAPVRADDASSAVLSRLAAAIAGARRSDAPPRVLLVCATEDAAAHDAILVPPLELDETAALVRAVLPHPLPADDVALIHRLSGGEPAAVCAFSAGLAADGRREVGEAGLAGVVQRIVARLGGGALALLRAIALSTEPLPEVAWDDVAGDRRATTELLRSGLVVARDSGLATAHAAVAEVGRADVAAADRAELHARVARALRPHEAAYPELLAEHLAGAGDLARSHDVARRGAERAVQQGDRRGAYLLYAWALDRAPAPPAHLAATLAHGVALGLQHGDPHTARRWAEELARLGPPTSATDLLLARTLIATSDLDRGVPLLERLAVEAAPDARMDAIVALAELAVRRRDHTRVLTLCDAASHHDLTPTPVQRDALLLVRAAALFDLGQLVESRGLYETLLLRPLTPRDQMRARRSLAAIEQALGQPDKARRAILALLEQARAQGDLASQGATLDSLAALASHTGRYAEAFARLDDLRALATASGDARYAAQSGVLEFNLRIDVGDFAGAEHVLARLAQATLTPFQVGLLRVLRAVLGLDRGTPEGVAEARLALADRDEGGLHPSIRAYLRAVRARLALAEGRAADALRAARELCAEAPADDPQTLEARLVEARALLALATFGAADMAPLQEAEQIAQRRGYAELGWQLTATVATALEALGDTTRARAHAARARAALAAIAEEVPAELRAAFHAKPSRREALGGGTATVADGREVAALDGVLAVVERYLARPELDFDAALDEVLHEAVRLWGAERGTVLLGDSLDKLTLARVHAVAGRPHASLEDLSRNVVRQVLEKGEALVVGDAALEGPRGESARRLKLRSVLA
ncbi:MAG TPA: hypothetical protein VG389_00090, partial [Myxococcota bacterium]|nr:hypothetical protein [Myxococcota bacterium]